MRHRDSHMKSPTADLMQAHISTIEEMAQLDGRSYHSWALFRWLSLANLITCLRDDDFEVSEILQDLIDFDMNHISTMVMEKGRPSNVYFGSRPSWDK